MQKEQNMSPAISSNLNYDQAITLAKDFMWDQLSSIPIGQALEIWLATLGKLTVINYRSGMRKCLML